MPMSVPYVGPEERGCVAQPRRLPSDALTKVQSMQVGAGVGLPLVSHPFDVKAQTDMLFAGGRVLLWVSSPNRGVTLAGIGLSGR